MSADSTAAGRRRTTATVEGYRQLLVALDASDLSRRASDEAIRIARSWEGEITGLHAYAARLHDHRFRQMEGSLPEQFRAERELERQRSVHDSLITRGLELISGGYLDEAERSCAQAGVRFHRRGVEGKNYRVIVDELGRREHDLVVLGAQGLGAVRPGLLGTVCQRVVRRTPIDALIVKSLERPVGDGPLVVGIDGSPQSFGALLSALELGERFGAPVHAVAAYDPAFHEVAFRRIQETLSEEAGRMFHMQEQEKLHTEIIDRGLARVYEGHLAVASSIALLRDQGLETALGKGKPFEVLLRHAERVGASLLAVGKRGIHADSDLDIGGTTEQVLALAEQNVLVGCRQHVPALELVADETIAWTDEASERLARAPAFVRPSAREAVLRYALEHGHTVVTVSVLQRAAGSIFALPMGEPGEPVGEAAPAAEVEPAEGLGEG